MQALCTLMKKAGSRDVPAENEVIVTERNKQIIYYTNGGPCPSEQFVNLYLRQDSIFL